MAFCYLHAADLHLDTPWKGLSIEDPALRKDLRDASLNALDALSAAAIRLRVSFVVLAGDVYDGTKYGLRAQLRLLQVCRDLDHHGIWVFIAHGNHDPVEEGWTAVRAWPKRTILFRAGEVDVVELVATDGTPVTVSGISYAERHTSEGLHARFPRPNGDGFHLAVLHAHVGEHPDHGRYSPCQLSDLTTSGHHAWALGHIHQRQVLSRRPFVAYPGNLQGRSFKGSEQGPKGALLVTVDQDHVTERFLDLAPIQFRSLEVDVSGARDIGEMLERLASAAAQSAPPTDAGRLVLFKARAVGVLDVAADLEEQDAEELLQSLRDVAPPGLRWMSLDLDVRSSRPLAALLGRNDLLGELARTAESVDIQELRKTILTQGPLSDARWADEDLADLVAIASERAAALLGEDG